MRVVLLDRRGGRARTRRDGTASCDDVQQPPGQRNRRCQQQLTDDLMTIRFTVKTIEKLCDVLRSQVDDVRRYLPSFDVIGTDPYPIPQKPVGMACLQAGRRGSTRSS